MSSLLREILDHKKLEVEASSRLVSNSELQAKARDQGPTRGFAAALRGSPHPVALIAEVKKASPSEGLIRPDFEASEIARAYADATADCLSVLTDAQYFQGSAENLQLARQACTLPILRKDFIVDAYQIAESRTMGADAILLIVAALSRTQLTEYREEAESLNLDVLVEVHTLQEAEAALESGATLVGVNNRDLSTFRTDLATSEEILPTLEGVIRVSESALNSTLDVERVQTAGARAVLIGTAFCRAPDIATKVREVMGW
jgi:indole-3-glycerol phosphate synthase